MSSYFQDKNVWITGASSGIGKALAYEINARGGFIILSARSVDKLQEVKSSLAHPENSLVLPMDMLDDTSIAQGVQDVQTQLGNVFMLINNAGRSQRSKVVETDIQVYDDLIQLNYLSVVKHTKQVLPMMQAHGSGHIITISSLAGKIGAPYRSGYAASKHALHGFFDCLRSEVAPDGILVTLICPGYVDTAIAHNALSADGKALGKSDPDNANGMKPAAVARAICNAAQAGKAEVLLGGKEVLGVYLKRFFPGILRKVLTNKSKTDFAT